MLLVSPKTDRKMSPVISNIIRAGGIYLSICVPEDFLTNFAIFGVHNCGKILYNSIVRDCLGCVIHTYITIYKGRKRARQEKLAGTPPLGSVRLRDDLKETWDHAAGACA